MTNCSAIFLELLHDFDSLPKTDKSASIFDIAGYPHYENVCSNILAFYLDPNNEHGLGNLFYSSLMNLAGGNELQPDNIQINREVSTKKGGRLDIVIKTDNQIIGIENKIFHHLSNDLVDYSDSIDELAKSDKSNDKPDQLNAVKIILSLRREQGSSGFVCITYDELWSKIRERLGGYVSTSSQKWLLYLVDFMTTVEGLNGKNMELDSRDVFFIENEEKVNALLNARNVFLAKLKVKITELLNITKKPEMCEKQWIYLQTCLVHDFMLSGHSIAFDLLISPRGWELQLFGRNPESQKYLAELFLIHPMSDYKPDLKDSRYILQRFKLTAELSTISVALLEWFDLLIKTENIKSAN